MICANCGKEFPSWIRIDGKFHCLTTRRYCLECSPFGQHNPLNLGISSVHSDRRDIEVKYCKNCGKPLNNPNKIYCNNQCQADFAYSEYIIKWKSGEISGGSGKNEAYLSKPVDRYIREKYNNMCARCGWNKVNSTTGTIPLEVDHIDGDSTNNKEENLILLCPNCHSLTPTYKGANKGRGKRER